MVGVYLLNELRNHNIFLNNLIYKDYGNAIIDRKSLYVQRKKSLNLFKKIKVIE